VHHERLFVQWFKRFIQTTKPNKEAKVLLPLDGHTAIKKKKNFQAVSLARGNGVILLSLQAHIKHRLQLLDVDCLKPLPVYFNQVCDKWMWQHSMRKITQIQISKLLVKFYGLGASVANAVTRFA
jgi:hypothetical protein